MFKVYDIVRVVKPTANEYKHFVGEIGIIIKANIGFEYPYTIIFLNDKLRAESEAEGGILWKDSELEGV